MFCRTMKNATTDTRITAPAAATRASTPIRARSETCRGAGSRSRAITGAVGHGGDSRST
jgi:hypothetical protein